MPKQIETHDEISGGLKIYFTTPQLTLGDIGIISSSIDYMLNKTAFVVSDLPFREDALFEEYFFFRRARRNYSYPIFVSADVTDLNFSSFSAETRIRIHRGFRDLSLSVTGSLIAAAIVAAFAASQGQPVENNRPERLPDLGPNITAMTQNLNSTGKSWELHIRDTQTGVKVVIKGNQNTESDR